MKPQTIYIERKINGEDGLPKESGYYHIITITGHKRTNYYSDIVKAFKDDDIDFWLEAVPVPEDDEIDEQSKKFTHPLVWRFGVTWLMGQLKLK